jgi:hypothetical protein
MLQHSEYEKQLIKQAKKLWKKDHQQEEIKKQDWLKEQVILREKRKEMKLTGIMEGEDILSDEDIVHWDYCYVIDDNEGKVVRSNISGTVRQLKRDLQSLGYKAETVRRCEMGKRKMF